MPPVCGGDRCRQLQLSPLRAGRALPPTPDRHATAPPFVPTARPSSSLIPSNPIQRRRMLPGRKGGILNSNTRLTCPCGTRIWRNFTRGRCGAGLLTKARLRLQASSWASRTCSTRRLSWGCRAMQPFANFWLLLRRPARWHGQTCCSSTRASSPNTYFDIALGSSSFPPP